MCTFWIRIDMIYDNAAITNTFVSVPADMSQFNAAAYLGGIINGVLDGAKFVSTIMLCYYM